MSTEVSDAQLDSELRAELRPLLARLGMESIADMSGSAIAGELRLALMRGSAWRGAGAILRSADESAAAEQRQELLRSSYQVAARLERVHYRQKERAFYR